MEVQKNREETVRRGQELYERQIRDKVEPQHNGRMLALDVNTGGYAIDADTLAAIDRVRVNNPSAELFVVRVGSPTAVKLGGHFRVLPR